LPVPTLTPPPHPPPPHPPPPNKTLNINQELFMLMHFLDPDKFSDPEAVANEFHDLNHQEQVRTSWV